MEVKRFKVQCASPLKSLFISEIFGQRRDFLRQAHAADGLVLRQCPAHFRFTSGVVRAQVALDERGLHAGRADAVAPDPPFHVIERDRLRHREHGPFGHRVRETLRDADQRRD